MVAIARALAFDAQVVILDEPTAALSQHEILEFYHIVERLKQDGKAILFISHKFDEIFELADYYTIVKHPSRTRNRRGKPLKLYNQHLLTAPRPNTILPSASGHQLQAYIGADERAVLEGEVGAQQVVMPLMAGDADGGGEEEEGSCTCFSLTEDTLQAGVFTARLKGTLALPPAVHWIRKPIGVVKT